MRYAFAAVAAFLAASSLCAQPAPEAATALVPKRLVTSERFMVVAAHPLAARAGYDAIRSGGSALEPAIELAQKGFPISPRLNALVAADRFLAQDANARRYFYLPDGKAKPVGTLLRNPEYAAVLKRAAAGGADAFYRGEIARDIAAAVRNHKRTAGDLAAADFSAYSAIRREPLCGEYRRWKV